MRLVKHRKMFEEEEWWLLTLSIFKDEEVLTAGQSGFTDFLSLIVI